MTGFKVTVNDASETKIINKKKNKIEEVEKNVDNQTSNSRKG